MCEHFFPQFYKEKSSDGAKENSLTPFTVSSKSMFPLAAEKYP